MTVPKHLPHYTYEDYVRWEGRWELIEGIPFAMSPQPSFRHQRISQRIAAELERALEGCEHCRAVLPVDWKISEDTVVQPDNIVVCGEVRQEAYLEVPPVLIFEVLSPSMEQKDRVVKAGLYAAQGVRYYVLVSPERLQAEVMELEEGEYRLRATLCEGTWRFNLGECQIDFDFGRIWKV
ncbi:MAG: Uma2 family endonuclease [Armatimonadota bacterium]|nr:Uma2 family endonuclease [bacterium]MDW8289507.1 Uma2 family endonuclease [Armatimonadota bacterium]